MFCEQAINFTEQLCEETKNKKIKWFRYPSAYPVSNNEQLRMFLNLQENKGYELDITNSYFSSNGMGAVFALTFKSNSQKPEPRIYAQQNIGVPPIELTYDEQLTTKTFIAIAESVEMSEGQPDGWYQFFFDFIRER